MMTNAKIAREYDPEEKMSKAEAEWYRIGVSELRRAMEILTKEVYYEPVTLKFGRLAYTPDFMHITLNNEIIFVEVKASRYQRGFDKTMVKIKAMAAAYPFFRYFTALQINGGWNIKEMMP